MILLKPEDDGYAAEVAANNTAISHSPEVVAPVGSTDDVIDAIAYAREHDLRVSVQAVGHTDEAITGGLLITTRRLDGISIDQTAGTATVQAGVVWSDVVTAAAAAGLFPITGSATGVSVVGYLLGGGLGPLSRTHGFSSDYLLSATVVLATGDVVGVSADDEPDLFWAVRGGKKVPGIVTDVTVRLVDLKSVYGGALYFEEKDIETAFRAWIDWTAGADPRVTTSAMLGQLPDLEMVPPPFRGRRILALRFAFPGSVAEGEHLAAPLRAAAPVYVDDLAEMPTTQIAKIHNDPAAPGPSWTSGLLLTHVDPTLASVVLDLAGPSAITPFQMVEIRQLGEAAARDVPEGSAVGGRSAGFTFGYYALDPSQFPAIPAAAAELTTSLRPWTAAESNINMIGSPRSAEQFSDVWPAPIWARLVEVRRRYDPDGLFAYEVTPTTA